MGTMFKSEVMSKCQFYLPQEAAYRCVAELGELGSVQFVDMNQDATSYQRHFVSEVRRCEKLERELRFIECEMVREEVKTEEDSDDPLALAPKELVKLEEEVATVRDRLGEVTDNYVALKKNQLELMEIRNMLQKTESFFKENQMSLDGEGGPGNKGYESLEKGDESLQLIITAGVIDKQRTLAFEKMLWRVAKGNVFINFSDIDEEIEDPKTGEKLYKTVFIIFLQGETLQGKVKKICDGFHAHVYPCPNTSPGRKEMLAGLNTRLEDLSTVMGQTGDHRLDLLKASAKTIRNNYVQIRKMKAVYHILNQFSLRGSQRVLIGEGWMPASEIPAIRTAMKQAAEDCGSTVVPTLEKIPTIEEHPTYHKTNKYTSGFQHLIDAYGVNTYREVNPGVFTIATFPFLFAVMFGDAGHGTIMLIFSAWMIHKELTLEKPANSSEIFKIIFGGRYIIFLMSLGAIYTGLIYNDIFAKSVNIFGSNYHVTRTFNATPDNPLNMIEEFALDPKDKDSFSGPYPFGVDPVWLSASNSIQFLNGFKMKISLIFGVLHMSFGVLLSVWNKVSRRQYHGLLLEFLPQLVFLLCLFGYLVTMIFIKWVLYGANKTGKWSEHCAPNLLVTFINMMLFKSDPHDETMDLCTEDSDIFMYPGQQMVQQVLVITGVMMVPILLLGKPLYILYSRRQRRAAYNQIRDDILDEDYESQSDSSEEDSFGEIMIYSGIHTIEYVLGSISHTASYLRLWALSLAHNQLSEVLWNLVMANGFSSNYLGAFILYPMFASWAVLTLSVMVLMEGLSAFLHTLRLHWVEFQSKFYEGAGYSFVPFEFRSVLREAADMDAEVLKTVNLK